MGLYEGIKDAIGIAQKADNIELYRQLIDLSSQALDMQTEIVRLREENAELKKGTDIENSFIRHEQPYLTLDGENPKVCYCAVCWGKNVNWFKWTESIGITVKSNSTAAIVRTIALRTDCKFLYLN